MNEKWISKNISNVRKKQTGIGSIGVLKDRHGNILYKEEDINKGYKEYFQRLLNTENGRAILGEMQKVEGPVIE